MGSLWVANRKRQQKQIKVARGRVSYAVLLCSIRRWATSRARHAFGIKKTLAPTVRTAQGAFSRKSRGNKARVALPRSEATQERPAKSNSRRMLEL